MTRLSLDKLTLISANPVEHVNIAAKLGCDAISLGLTSLPLGRFGYEGLDLFRPWSLVEDAMLRRELKAALADTGLSIALGETLRVQPGVDAAESAAQLDLFADLGACRVNAISSEPDTARAHDQLAKLAEMTVERGIAFIVEFAPTNAINTLAGAVAAMEHVGRDRCRIMLDAMHFFRSGGVVEDMTRLDPSVIGYAQICDAPRLSAGGDYMQEAVFGRLLPGAGELPLAEWLAALPPDCEIGIEVPDMAAFMAGLSLYDHAARAVAATRALLGEVTA